MSNNYVEIADAKYDGVRNVVFDTLGQRLNQDSADLKGLQEQVDVVKNSNTDNINQLNAKINQANNDIDAIGGDIQAINQNIDTIESEVANIEDNLLPTKIDKLTSTVVNRLPKFNSTTGDLGSSGVSVDDNNNLSANTLMSSVAQGTAPFQVTSNTKVTNLNTDLLDGYEATDFLRIAQIAASLGATSGNIKIPTNDSGKVLILKYGIVMGVASSGTVTFAEPFPNIIPVVTPILDVSGGTFATSIRLTSRTKSGFTWNTWSGGTLTTCDGIVWFAIGY